MSSNLTNSTKHISISVENSELFNTHYQLFRDWEGKDLNQAIGFLQQAIQYAETLGNPEIIAKCYIDLSRSLRRAGEYERAITKALVGIQNANPTTDKILISKAYNNIGLCYMSKGDIKDALQYFLASLREVENLQPEYDQDRAGVHLNLAIVFCTNRDYENSLKHLDLAHEILKKINSLRGLIRCYNEYGNLYVFMQKMDLAEEYYIQSLQIARQANDLVGQAIIYNNLAGIFEKRGNFEKALKYAFESVETKKKIEDKHAVIVVYEQISKIHVSMGAFDEALKYLHLSLDIANEIGANIEKMKIFEHFAETYAALGDFQQAYLFHQKFSEQQTLIFNQEKEKSIAEMRTRYEIDQKEREIELQRQVEEEVRRYAHRLEDSNTELEQFAHVVSHDLREPLRMVKSYMQLLHRRLKDELSEELQEFFGFAIDGASRMERLILDVLSLSSIQKSKKQLQLVDFNDVIFIVMRNLDQFIKDKNAAVTADTLPTLNVDESQMLQLFQNFVSNGLKYNQSPNPTVHVTCKDLGNAYEFAFVDNGIGIPQEEHDRIFEMFHRLHNKQISGSGIGLSICKKIVERHDGTIRLVSEIGKGSTFYITIPLHQEN